MTVREQFKNLTPIIIIVFAATLVVLSVVIFLGLEYNVQLNYFTKDPMQILDAPFYLGFFSNMGVLLWCSSMLACFFSRALLKNSMENKISRKFLFFSGAVTMLFLLDDLCLMHEDVFPHYLGVPERFVFLIYINIVLLYVISMRDYILSTEYMLLGLACFLIGMSTFVKRIPMPIPEDTFLQDVAKLFGIIIWFIYFIRVSYKEVIREMHKPAN